MLCWFGERAQLQAGRASTRSKHTSKWARALVKDLHYRLDVNTLHRDEDADSLSLNEIGRVTLRTTAAAVLRRVPPQPRDRFVHPRRRGDQRHRRRGHDRLTAHVVVTAHRYGSGSRTSTPSCTCRPATGTPASSSSSTAGSGGRRGTPRWPTAGPRPGRARLGRVEHRVPPGRQRRRVAGNARRLSRTRSICSATRTSTRPRSSRWGTRPAGISPAWAAARASAAGAAGRRPGGRSPQWSRRRASSISARPPRPGRRYRGPRSPGRTPRRRARSVRRRRPDAPGSVAGAGRLRPQSPRRFGAVQPERDATWPRRAASGADAELVEVDGDHMSHRDPAIAGVGRGAGRADEYVTSTSLSMNCCSANTPA